MKNIIILTILTLILIVPISSQSTNNVSAIHQDQIEKCADKVIPYSLWSDVKNPVFNLKLDSSTGGQLHYFGAVHSRDLDQQQFKEIENAWEDLKPDVAFYEGPNRPIFETREETIRKTGESGFVRYLAKKDGIPFITLEASPIAEVKGFLEKYSAEQVMLFFILRETSRLREREGLSEKELKGAISQLLVQAKNIGGFESIPKDLFELEKVYKRYWKTPQNWWEAPTKWFDPGLSSSQTGGIFTNEINKMSSGFRDLHMYKLLAQNLLEGKKVFAVVGRNHVPMQVPALKCVVAPKKIDGNAQSKVEQMMKALGGFKNWAEVKSLYVRAIHKEDRYEKPYQSEILRNLDARQFKMIQQDDEFHTVAYVDGDKAWIVRKDGKTTKMSDKSFEGLIHWDKHLVYRIFHIIGKRSPGLKFEVDEKDRLIVYENDEKLAAFGLNEKNLPEKFYIPKADGDGESLTIFSTWGEGNGLVYPTTSKPQENKAIFVALEWKPSKEKLKIQFSP